MLKPSLLKRGDARVVLCLLALALCCVSAAAQSGRRKPGSPPTPTTTQPQGEQGASGQTGPKSSGVLVSFVVIDFDDVAFVLDTRARDGVVGSFVRRLDSAATVAVTRGGRGTRKEARDRAKKEEDAWVVLFELEEEEVPGRQSRDGRVDVNRVVIRTYVYEPKTGDLKYTDTIYQRPYLSKTDIGGVRVPLPTRVERYPSQHELEQAGRDAADRLLGRFNITLPPER